MVKCVLMTFWHKQQPNKHTGAAQRLSRTCVCLCDSCWFVHKSLKLTLCESVNTTPESGRALDCLTVCKWTTTIHLYSLIVKCEIIDKPKPRHTRRDVYQQVCAVARNTYHINVNIWIQCLISQNSNWDNQSVQFCKDVCVCDVFWCVCAVDVLFEWSGCLKVVISAVLFSLAVRESSSVLMDWITHIS